MKGRQGSHERKTCDMRPIETLLGKTVFGEFLCCFQRDCLRPRGPQVDDDAYTDSGLECGLKDLLLGAQRLSAGTIDEADQFSPGCTQPQCSITHRLPFALLLVGLGQVKLIPSTHNMLHATALESHTEISSALGAHWGRWGCLTQGAWPRNVFYKMSVYLL